MKVIMIGTPVCVKCKRIAPELEEYCSNHNIVYQYYSLQEAPAEILDILKSKNVRQAPAFIIYKGEETVVISGDDIFMELESL